MAATLSSLAIVSGGALGFRRSGPRPSSAVKVVYPFSSRSHIGSGFRFGAVLKLHKNHTSRGFNIQPLNANNSDSSGSDKPPLATILAGIVVFLLFLWVVSSVVLWIVGLIGSQIFTRGGRDGGNFRLVLATSGPASQNSFLGAQTMM